MNTQVTLNLPPSLYIEAQRVAKQANVRLEDVLVQFTERGLAQSLPEISAGQDPDIEREKNAYLAMHSALYASMPGQHVAIHQGELVDQDTDLDRLWLRVEAQYPNQYVWVTTVHEQPIQTVHVPSVTVRELSA